MAPAIANWGSDEVPLGTVASPLLRPRQSRSSARPDIWRCPSTRSRALLLLSPVALTDSATLTVVKKEVYPSLRLPRSFWLDLTHCQAEGCEQPPWQPEAGIKAAGGASGLPGRDRY